MNTCPVCVGKGLIGSGERPFELEGVVKTCPNCTGSGTVPEMEPVEPEDTEEATE